MASARRAAVRQPVRRAAENSSLHGASQERIQSNVKASRGVRCPMNFPPIAGPKSFENCTFHDRALAQAGPALRLEVAAGPEYHRLQLAQSGKEKVMRAKLLTLAALTAMFVGGLAMPTSADARPWRGYFGPYNETYYYGRPATMY